ncbi:hypothetical protein PVAP13_5NG192981 [Panicum virgatum]|uniref:Uncharacterized protein n=1 Tax=Panicum virgatum TaxID=38727 RepID=A0A8T0RTA5_PANVG|nr:hypothetical protein PVAP13_5NG192981 [Panicum virgatum]
MAGEARPRGSLTAASMERGWISTADLPQPRPERAELNLGWEIDLGRSSMVGVHGGRALSSVLDLRRRRRAPSSSAPNSGRRPCTAERFEGSGAAWGLSSVGEGLRPGPRRRRGAQGSSVARSLAGGGRRRTSVATEGSGAARGLAGVAQGSSVARGLAGGGEELERRGALGAETSSQGWTLPAEKAA